MLDKFGQVPDFRQLRVITLWVTEHENQAPYPAERDGCSSPLKHDKFKQIFPNIHHRDHGTLSHNLRTHELHPDGEVRPLV